MKLGVVGLPNVGKSTLFNAITNAGAMSANYPFCTIEPNVGVVAVPDERLAKLAALYDSKKITPTTLEFVDIAGLVKGASRGEGLGNKFLSHIREVDAIVHVVRCFDDENITHVDGSVDPVRDIETINLELIFSDMEALERRIAKAKNMAKGGDKKLLEEAEFMEKLYAHLESGKPVRTFSMTTEQKAEVDGYFFLRPKKSFMPPTSARTTSEQRITPTSKPSRNLQRKKAAKLSSSAQNSRKNLLRWILRRKPRFFPTSELRKAASTSWLPQATSFWGL